MLWFYVRVTITPKCNIGNVRYVTEKIGWSYDEVMIFDADFEAVIANFRYYLFLYIRYFRIIKLLLR